MSSKIPRGMPLPTEAKRGHRLESKDTASANPTQKSDSALRSHKENVPWKSVGPKVHTGVSTRYGQQSELKEQNQQLMASNEELQKKLTQTQQQVAEMELQFTDLEKENMGLQKNLKDLHVLLVTAKIDPVAGEKVGDAARQNEDQRKEVMSVSSELLHKLRALGDTASRQRAQLEEAQARMADLDKAREHMKQERENFSLEAAEMEKALKDAEALLL